MSKKPRIVIRAFTRRRDLASAALLSRLLEHQGCDVLITCGRDFERTIRQWKPEVVVVNTIGMSRRVKEMNPEIKTVFLDGEGFLPDEYAHSISFSNDRPMYRAIDLLLLWGETVKGEITTALQNEDTSKIHVVGNPQFDLITYLPDEIKNYKNKKSVGAVMRYPTINWHDGIPPIRTLPNPGNLERVVVQCQSFVGVIDSIRALLEETDFTVSIRPHPLEQVESYRLHKANWFGAKNAKRVDIDDSVSFSDWAVKQKALITPTSTSLLEAYLLKVPVINIDALCNTDEYNKNYAKVAQEWQGAAGLTPDTIEELVEMLNSDIPEVERNDDIERQLEKYCSTDANGSAALTASKYIIELSQKPSKSSGARMPTWLVDVIDDLSFRRACLRNPLHPNMHYRRGFHDLPENLEAIVENIILQSKQ